MTEIQHHYQQKAADQEDSTQSEPPVDSFSFIVRVWKESSTTADENSAGWRGSIERVGLNQRMYIHQLESVLAFIEEQTGMRAKRAHPIKALLRGLRQWWSSIRRGHG